MSVERSTTERLASLETWADARSKEIQRLKGSVSALQKENFDVKTDMVLLREENENLMKMNENLSEKVDSLERRVTYSPGQAIPRSSPDEGKLEGLETTVAALVKDIHFMQADKQEIKTLGRKIEKLDGLETTVAALVKEIPVMQTNKQEIKTLGRKIGKFEGLETTVSALMKDIPVMQADNQEIKTLGRKIEKLDGLETTVSALVKGIHVMQTNKEEIKTLGRKIESFGDLEDRVSTMENDVSAVKRTGKKFACKTKALKRKLLALSSKVQGIEQTVDQLSGLRRVLCRTLVASQGGPIQAVGAKVDALDTRTKAIEKKMGDVHDSITRIHVKTRDGKLVTGQYVPLDTRDDGWGGGIVGLSDGGRGRVVVRRDGRYGVGARWIQRGKGVVVVSVDWAGSCCDGQDLGRTSGDKDVACGMMVVELKEGDEVWLEACSRLEGGARIWFEMFCWLL